MLYELIIYFSALFIVHLFGSVYDKFFLKSIVSKFDFNVVERFIIKLIVGLFLSISLFATFKSMFTSLYFIFFVILILAPLIFKKKIQSFNKVENLNVDKIKLKHLVFIPIALFFFFYHQLLFVYSNSTPFYDFLFLSKIASGLFDNGIESFYSATSAYYGVNVNPHLYHYFDLWFTGIISGVLNYSEFDVLLFICFPFFHLIVFLLLYVIFEHLFKSFYLSFLLAFGVLFGSKVFILQQGSFFELVETYRGLPYSLFYKLLMIYIVVLAAYFFYLKKLKIPAVISICALMVIYPTTIPAFFTLAFFSLVYSFYKSKKISYFFVAILSVIIYIIIFQKIVNYDKITNLTFHLYSIKQYCILFIETVIKITIEHYLTILLFLFVSIKYFRLLIKNRIITYSIICLLGSILYVYFNPPGIRDLNQIISNLSPVLMLILTIELIRYIKSNIILKSVILIAFFIGCYNIYFNFSTPNNKLIGKEIKHSEKFTKSVNAFVVKHANENFCSFSSVQPYDYYYHTDMKFNYLLKLKDLKTPLEIKILFEDKNSIEKYKIQNKYYPPNSYFSSRKNTGLIIYQYLKKNNFKYLLVENFKNNKIGNFIKDHCTLILQDEITSDAVYSLN